MTSEVTACDVVLLGLIRGEKRPNMYLRSIRITCFVLWQHPPPPQIKMYSPVICWVKKTNIEFYIYSK